MTTKYIQLLITGLLFFTAASAAWAQNYSAMREELNEKQKDTRNEIQLLKEQISQYQQRITQTENKFDRLYKQARDLQKELELRNELINKLQKEREHILEEIQITEESLRKLEKRLEQLIETYQTSLAYLYKHGRTSQLALLLTADSFNQMLIRAKYLEKFEAYRQEQASEIEEAKIEFEQKKSDLEDSREKNANVLAEIETERENLREKKEQQVQMIATLRKNKSRLNEKLQDTQSKIEDLNTTLTELILEEEKIRKAQAERLRKLEAERKRRLAAARKIEDAEKRAAEIAKYSEPITSPERIEAPSDEMLSEIETAFSKMQGSFPMPVDNGVITEDFGTQVHPVYGTKINNPGVEIAAEPRSVVRAVYDGYVYAVQPIRGYGDVVLVNHGKYKTVYANLSEIMVSKGTFLKSGEIIGLSGDEDSTLGASVFFMIRNGKKNLNPEHWFAKN